MQVLMALVAVIGVILYRMSVLAALSLRGNDVVTSNAIIFTSATAALINLICIMIFNQVFNVLTFFSQHLLARYG